MENINYLYGSASKMLFFEEKEFKFLISLTIWVCGCNPSPFDFAVIENIFETIFVMIRDCQRDFDKNL